MPTEKNQIRIDFVHTGDVKVDEKTRQFSGTLIPDPDRYIWETIDGKKYLIDKFDNLAISEDEFGKMFENAKNLPIYAPSKPKIPDINKYVKKRIKPINDFLTNKKQEYSAEDKSEEFLKSREKDEMKFVILTVDLKGSTVLSQSLGKIENAKIISLFAREMASVINNYRGFVLKYVGDGLIAYFPEPNFIGMNDNAVDCALAMILVLRNAINKVLLKHGLPKLKLRIGIDSGEAMIVDMGLDIEKMHKDLISETVNLSSKIQSLAAENSIAIGDSTARNLHVTRRKYFDKTIPDGWKYTTKSGDVYPVHILRLKQYVSKSK